MILFETGRGLSRFHGDVYGFRAPHLCLAGKSRELAFRLVEVEYGKAEDCSHRR
jgi:hypothetical protein